MLLKKCFLIWCFLIGIKSTFAGCGFLQWQCDDGSCIDNEDLCDGRPHCLDNSDETVQNCAQFTCPKYAFRCAYGACIPRTKTCDTFFDCLDHSDEFPFLCEANINEEAILKGNCTKDYSLECQKGDCIDIDRRCDGKVDCSNGYDESAEICLTTFCPKYAFRCAYGACIPGNFRCNGEAECRDGSDELTAMCEKKDVRDYCIAPMNHEHLQMEIVGEKSNVQPGDQILFGKELRFKCEKGWHLLGVKRSLCKWSGWTNPAPYCTKYCPLHVVQRGISTFATCTFDSSEFSCSSTIPVGATALISCANGYILNERDESAQLKVMRCNSNGEWHTAKLKCHPKCGQTNANNKAKPWDVSIFRLEGSLFKHQCFGTILSPKIVISAEICFESIKTASIDEHEFYSIIPGNYAESFLPNKNIGRSIYNISEIILESSLHNTDGVVLLVLVNYFDFSKNISPICVQFKKFTTSPYIFGSAMDILGYHNNTANGASNEQIRKINQRSIHFLASISSKKHINAPIRYIDINNFENVIKKYIERYIYIL